MNLDLELNSESDVMIPGTEMKLRRGIENLKILSQNKTF